MNDDNSNQSHCSDDEMPIEDVIDYKDSMENLHDNDETMSNTSSTNDDNIHIDPETNRNNNDKSHQDIIHPKDEIESGSQNDDQLQHDSLQSEKNNSNERQGDANANPIQKIDSKSCFKEKSKQLVSSIENLQSRIDDVIAFPTLSNFKRLHHQGSAAHYSFLRLSQVVEFGTNTDSSNKTASTNTSDDDDDDDTLTSTNHEEVQMDDSMRSKLSSLGTNMWLNIENNPKVFRDYVSSTNNNESTVTATSTSATTTPVREAAQDDTKDDSFLLQKERAAASGYIRSLACRLILITKIQTKGLVVPKLVMTTTTTTTTSSVSKNSSSNDHNHSMKSDDLPIIRPLAMNAELEFAFKCLSRAGRAMFNHSSFTSNTSSSTPSELLPPDTIEASASYTTLCLALEVWSSLDQTQKMNNNYSKRSLFLDEAFDVMLLLPDCVMTSKRTETDGNINDNVQTNNEYNDTTSTITQLKRLENFINDQIARVGSHKNQNQELKIIQYFLPSLARTSYKHGNRLARTSDYTASQEAIRISLTSTDKCLAMIKDKISDNNEEDGTSVPNNMKRSFEIQEQEMLVLSKQSFYVLSHVYKSTQKIDEAKKCLDQIEKYVDEQIGKDDKQYKDILKQFSEAEAKGNEPFASLSGFALEGPRKQDIAEIKARATSAWKRAKHAEKMERLNLSYCRIMLGNQCKKVSDEEEKQVDVQFKTMVKLVKEIESSFSSDIDSSNNTYKFPSKSKDDFELVFTAARSIFIRREKSTSENRLGSPYDVLFSSYGRNHDKYVAILLEFLNAILVLANDLHQLDKESFVRQTEKIDKRAMDIGKELISNIRQTLTKLPKESGLMKSTLLFSTPNISSTSTIAKTISDIREHFTRALSIYYASGKDYVNAIEWCDLLIEILLVSRQVHGDEVCHESSEKAISEIIATKALSLSMTNCHGAALKTAREAFEKCGTVVGNIVTLFHCSVHYEVNSMQNDSQSGIFENTMLELDSAISNFLAAPKYSIHVEKEIVQKILEAFPVMFNTVMEVKAGTYNSLLIGLQKRYIDLLIDYLTSMVSKGELNLNDDVISEAALPGNINVFHLLCSFLATFDEMFSSSETKDAKWSLKQIQSLQTTLDGVMRLLVECRDACNNKSDPLSQFSLPFTEMQGLQDTEILLFQRENVSKYIGSSEDCLLIAEQLWNIATQAMSNACDDLDYKSKVRRSVADLYGKAHDFALLSEEVYGKALTKGNLDLENFDSKPFKSKMIDFTSSARTDSIDICSEFSVQCLLLKVAYIIDDFTDLYFTGDNTYDKLSADENAYLSKAMNCLIGASIEIHVLDVDINENVVEEVPWLALSLLISLREDEYCSFALTKRGLLSRLERSLTEAECQSVHQQESHPQHVPSKRIFFLGTRAEYFGMNETTKLLYSLYTKETLKCGYGMSSVCNSITIGLIQRKIISLSSRVDEVVDVFKTVYDQVKQSETQNDENARIAPYDVEDMDYFVVEAHNRAISLLYVGDFTNAEQLLTIALNLIPYSGKEVECHASDIRNVYRGVIQRCSEEGNISASFSSDNMIRLFK